MKDRRNRVASKIEDRAIEPLLGVVSLQILEIDEWKFIGL
jgi:hypothetical protein